MWKQMAKNNNKKKMNSHNTTPKHSRQSVKIPLQPQKKCMIFAKKLFTEKTDPIF